MSLCVLREWTYQELQRLMCIKVALLDSAKRRASRRPEAGISGGIKRSAILLVLREEEERAARPPPILYTSSTTSKVRTLPLKRISS